MSVPSPNVMPRPRWLIHDAIIGLLAGAGVGSLVGIFMSVRWFDNNLITVPIAVAGAVIGVLALLRSHKLDNQFLTASVVAAWALLAVSGSVLAALASAIINFT